VRDDAVETSSEPYATTEDDDDVRERDVCTSTTSTERDIVFVFFHFFNVATISRRP